MPFYRVLSRSGRELVAGGLDVKGDTVADLQTAFHEASKRRKVSGSSTVYYPERQRWSLPTVGDAKPVTLDPAKKLSDYGLKANDALTFKDLGRQIGYSRVFFWEYFGPLVVYAAVFAASAAGLLHGGAAFTPGPAQRLALAYHSLHYAKRIAETFLVHDFSHGTMPLGNLFRNCAYYWSFAGTMSFFINHPLYTSPPLGRVYAGFAAALACQALNAGSHVVLARLRADGSKGYKIPHGWLTGFSYVTCANYMWEILGWACFNVATQSAVGIAFNLVGAAQMVQWALAKHARRVAGGLRRTFDGKDGRAKYPRRWVILPPFL